MLRVLGFTGAQLRTSLATQVLAYTLVGTVLGWVVGIAAGRQAWALIAGTVPLPVVVVAPVAALIGVPMAALLATNPFRRAATGVRLAIALRRD